MKNSSPKNHLDSHPIYLLHQELIPLSVAIFYGEPRHKRIFTSIGAMNLNLQELLDYVQHRLNNNDFLPTISESKLAVAPHLYIRFPARTKHVLKTEQLIA